MLSTKDFTLNPLVLKLQKGFRYEYSFVQSASSAPQDIDIYVTEETPDAWEVIAGTKERDVAYLMRLKISKSDLTFKMTNSLKQNEVLGNVEYKNPKDVTGSSNMAMIFPFWLIWVKEAGNLNLNELIEKKITVLSSGPSDPATLKIEKTVIKYNFLVNEIIVSGKQENQNGKIYASTSKPYLLTNLVDATGGGLVFKGVQKKDFSLSDFAGYRIGGYTATPVLRAPVPVEKSNPEQVPTQSP